MKAKAKKLWIEGLTNGTYKQICSFMRETEYKDGQDIPKTNGKNNMCVMGVLADIAMRDAGFSITLENWIKFSNRNEEPSARTLEWAGLTKSQSDKMIDYNDGKEKTFAEFAEYIKEKF